MLQSRHVWTALVLCLTTPGAWAGKEYAAKPGEQVVPNQLLVKLKTGASPASVINAFLQNAQMRSLGLRDIYLVDVPGGIPPGIATLLAAHGLVDFVEPNRVRHSDLGSPNDPYYSNSISPPGEWGLFQIQALQAWSLLSAPYLTAATAGTNRIKVAVLDSGADCTHPDFINAGGSSTNSAFGGQLLWTASQAFTSTTIASPACAWQDDHGHGTHVAGIVAAATSNGVGMSSLGYPLQVIVYKVLDKDGSGSDVTISNAIVAAADAGAQVISMSLGGAGYSQTLQSAINYAWQKNSVVVAAAGNSATSALFFPGGANHTVGVSAVDSNGSVASFSNFGNSIAVAAPGVNILSTVPTYAVTLGCCNYGFLSGTSMATPFVSALAGLIAMTTPNATAAAIVQRIEQTAFTTAANGAWCCAPPAQAGSVGYGTINAYNAIAGAARATSTGGVVGQIVDIVGNAVFAAQVTIGAQVATTDASGLYWFHGLPAGVYPVSVAASGFATQPLNVTVAPGADTSLSVRMGITYGSFSGAVTDQGSPVAGAIVQALSGGLVTGTAVTDGNGQYTLWVPAGSGYALQASQIGRSTTAISSFTASAGASTFVNLNLPSLNGAIAGAVADTNGSPVSGAQVSVTSAVFTGSAIANAAGAYSVAGVPPGSYSVTATAAGYSSGTRSAVTVSADSTTTVNFQLTPPPVAAPTFSIPGGTYAAPISVAIGTTTSGASIRYTLDGSTPSATAGTLYTGPIAINATTTINAIAFAAGLANSPVSSAAYVISLGGWYNTGGTWANRKAITIDHTKVSGASALAQFPMLVSITDANLQAATKADGSDIVFTAGDGVTKLSHEIESYNSATGQLTAWVNVPSVSPSADTVIYLYYGNPSAPNQQNAAGVWDANYKGVWHLGNGTTVTAADSTANAANGTINGSIPAAAGAIGGGASFSGVAANYISIPNAPVAGLGNSFTMEAWVSSTSAGRETLFSFGDQLTTPEVEFNSAATGQWGAIITGTYETLTSAHVMQSDGTLHHIVYTKNGAGATHALYLDGVAQSLSTNNPVTYVNATNPLWIGKRGAATQPWGGVVDELRISTTVRTAAWIATEYANQKTPASFLFVGPQQVHP